METENIRLITMALVVCLGTAAPAIAIGIIAKQGLDSIGRNPETENAVRTTMVLAIGFTESLAIFALFTGLIIKFVK